MTNKNQQIAIKSSELLDKIKDKIILELFDFTNIKSIDLSGLKIKNQNLQINNINSFNNLNDSIQREINEENIKTNNIIKNKEITANSILKKQCLKVIEDNLSIEKESSSLEEEKESKRSSSFQEVIKMDSTINAKKIKFNKKTSFNKDRILQILYEYFDLKANNNVEFDFAKFIKNIENSINKNTIKKPPPKIFLRKRICLKLNKLFSLIVRFFY